ncbi:MAG: DUF1413 domain-containing protein [Synergistaceae bacterium]|nr:DUF1413 domain-containing protein [Synergistaceae bacterium]
MNYDKFLNDVKKYVEKNFSSGDRFELNELPFWGEVEHPTTFGKKFLEDVSEGKITELEALPKSTDNHQWYRVK